MLGRGRGGGGGGVGQRRVVVGHVGVVRSIGSHDEEKVREFFTAAELGHLADQFIQEGYDRMRFLNELEKEDLIEMGFLKGTKEYTAILMAIGDINFVY